MNKTFAKEQKYACYLASWSAIIFIPCRGYSVSLFLGFNLNLTDVALALKAEPQSANLFHLPCSTRIARGRIVQLPTSFFCGAEGKERVLQQRMYMACISVKSYVLISFQSVGGLLLTLKQNWTSAEHFWKLWSSSFWVVYLVPSSHKEKQVHLPIFLFLLYDFSGIYKNNNVPVSAFTVILTWG